MRQESDGESKVCVLTSIVRERIYVPVCMPSVLTVRIPDLLLAKVDRKAAALGRTRAEYVRQVLEADVASGSAEPERFACLSLRGHYALGRGSGNLAVRRALPRRAHKKDR
jgi:hypothetical protein